jgi:tetratricopeptide (TPR) repeat protein
MSSSALPSATEHATAPAGLSSPKAAHHSLFELLRRYEESVEKLQADVTASALLDVLLIRDAIEQAVTAGSADDRRCVDEILKSDNALRNLPRHAVYGVRASLIEWRQSLTPSADAWWWYLDRALPPRLERIERILLVLSVVLFPFSLGVAIELARLYGVDSGGFVTLLPIAATFLGSFSIGGVLSLNFRDRWTELLEEIGFGPRLRVSVTFLIFVLLSLIVGSWFARPWLSRHYNDAGVAERVKQRPLTQLSSAQMDLERAVRFNPQNAVAHYNLGRLYEDLFDDDRAVSEYLIAFAGGLDLAGNNVAHIYLRRGQYDRAALALQRTFILSDPEANKGDADLRYAVLKNFGWARYGQSRLPEARRLLADALRIEPDRADAHCLLAKTLTMMKDDGAQNEWRSCLGLGWHDANEPARETWISEAKTILEKTP